MCVVVCSVSHLFCDVCSVVMSECVVLSICSVMCGLWQREGVRVWC